ncbi:hypothetical protein BWD42_07465 [Sphingobacterium sp. CZ-UAM]|uniref:hypothetical protein n=1 Tax=Sphingobacterium sp. CZ-UAM TaxID=1933868 RepID=UPI000984DA87|nr:hypothetical protein [Sphingobacterium sp. CZ-UAM]OOG19732.1 hypothetical protein BWD42_07465 [Sphingobacterium sp. CZ-UAM]
MERKLIRRYSKEIKEKVVFAIVSGELWLEEAMLLYHIQDRRTVIDWLRKYQREQKKARLSLPMENIHDQGGGERYRL